MPLKTKEEWENELQRMFFNSAEFQFQDVKGLTKEIILAIQLNALEYAAEIAIKSTNPYFHCELDLAVTYEKAINNIHDAILSTAEKLKKGEKV